MHVPPLLRLRRRPPHHVAADVLAVRTGIVNVMLVGPAGAGPGGWVLVDAGLPGQADHIADEAKARFGDGPPAAIVLTHGHHDHVGALRALLDRWPGVLVYAHPDEMPFLDGRQAYSPPDPSVGGGAMPLLALAFSRGPFHFGSHLHPLPVDGSVPGMPGWTWIHTPGHTPGHVSLWREADRVLIAGDAFVTTNQQSVGAVLAQRPELHGPPQYFTPDWAAAKTSVQRLAALDPTAAATGHGTPFHGHVLRDRLRVLARDFDHLAVPPRGRYVPEHLHRVGRHRTARWAVPAGLAVASLAAGVLLRSRRD